MPGHEHPRPPRVVVTQFATAVAACFKRARSMQLPGADPAMTRRDHGAGGSMGHHPHAASRSPGRGGQHRRREQPEGPPGRGHGTRARHAGVPGAGTGRRADAPALRRPVRRGPARTRCSAHLRPVEHATSCQRVIGREAPGWQADSPLTGYPSVTDTSRLDGRQRADPVARASQSSATDLRRHYDPVPRREPTLIAAASSQATAGSRCGTFSQAELTEDKVITRCITAETRAAFRSLR